MEVSLTNPLYAGKKFSRQKAEDSRQKAEDSSQESEFRRQDAVDRGQCLIIQ